MADRQTMLRALRNADKAGDVAAAKRIAGMIKALDTPQVQTSAAPTPVAQELLMQPQGARQQYAKEMAAQAFGDRPTSGEYLQAGLFGTRPMRPSELQGGDWRQQEPGLEPAFMPDIIGGIGAAAFTRGTQNLTRSALKRQAAAKRSWMDDLVEPYMGRAKQIERELRGADKSLWGTYKFRLSKQMNNQKDVLKTVPGVKSSKNLRDNLAAVNQEINNSGKKLTQRLAASNKSVSKIEVESAIRQKLVDYKKTLRGVGFKVDDELVEDSVAAILRAMDDVPSTPEGLWKARKLVDKEFKALNGPRRYAAAVSGDPSTLIPTKNEVIWDLSRQAMLDLMEKKVKGSTKDMRRMSILYDIQHTLATKSPDVKQTLSGRVKEHIPFMGEKTMQLKPRNWINR
jgi:hypothetical protein